ncbi:MAG: TolC family protein [Planctomycetes bacterium]|nr:TolC family protein [Planctomycetota bacterium]
MKRLALLILPALALAACATPPPPQSPEVGVTVPQNWTETPLSAGEVPDAWWIGFGDPRLDALIAEALQNNPTLRQAESRIAVAAATTRTVQAGAMPNVTGSVDGSRTHTVQSFGGPSLTELETQRVGVSLNLQWEIDLWGRVRAAQSAAIADRQAAEAAYQGARLSMIAQVAKAYFSASEAWQQLKLAEKNLDSANELADRVDERFKAGLRTALDVRLALADVAATKSRLETRKRLYKLSRRQLEVLLGRYPAALIETPSTLPRQLPAAPGGLPAQLLMRRPDIVEAERKVAAADSRVRSAYLDLLPRISLTTSTGLASDQVGDILDGKFFVWNLLGNLLAPLFDGGRRWAEIDRTRALEEGALAYYAVVALNAFAEVEGALSNEYHLRIELNALQESADQSAAAVEISTDRYYQGALDITQVLQARRQYYSSESARLTAQLALVNTRVDLFAALGGGFDASSVLENGDHHEGS